MRLLPRTIAGRVVLVAAIALALGALADAAAPALLVAAAGAALLAAWLAARSISADVDDLASSMRRSVTAERDRYASAEADRDRLATLLREMTDAVLIVAPDDRVALANPAAERLLGSRGIVGRHLAEVARDGELIEAVEVARREAAGRARIERADPRRTVNVVARRLPGADVLVTAYDLTELRRLETVRRDFVANVSHELRTPLASLKAMAEALESGALDRPADARDFVRRMHREIDDLTQLVTELLTLTRLEAGAAELRPAAVPSAELLAAVAGRLGPLADRAGVTLSVEPTDAPAVLADRERVETVLANLVHNAVKFTPRGGRVTLAAARDADVVRFEVRDSGEGIAREDLERVFERFYKAERSRSSAGTGLGLAIAKHLVLAHGGEIHALSEGPGGGSTFAFTLPVAAVARV